MPRPLIHNREDPQSAPKYPPSRGYTGEFCLRFSIYGNKESEAPEECHEMNNKSFFIIFIINSNHARDKYGARFGTWKHLPGG